MNLTRFKKRIWQALPPSIRRAIRWVRDLGYQVPEELLRAEAAFNQLQTQATRPGAMVLRPGLELAVDPESRYPFSWFCWLAPDMVREMDAFIECARGAGSFVDVGANHGIFSLVFLALNPGGRALAIDPSPIAGPIRLRNRALNGMDSSLLSQEVACGATEGEVKMHFNWHHLEVSGKGDEKLAAVTVPVRTLDALCGGHQLQPEVVKIDVEGFELEVLQGAEETLGRARILFLEIHPDLLEKLNTPMEHIFDWLASRGWRLRTPGGPVMTRIEFLDRFHTFWVIGERGLDAPHQVKGNVPGGGAG